MRHEGGRTAENAVGVSVGMQQNAGKSAQSCEYLRRLDNGMNGRCWESGGNGPKWEEA